MADKLVARLSYRMAVVPDGTQYPPTLAVLIRSGRHFGYEGERSHKSTFPIKPGDAEKYRGYTQVQFFGSDEHEPLVSWDLPRSAPDNVLVRVGVGGTSDNTFSLSFSQRCFFSTSGKVYWAFNFTPENATLAVKKAGCSTVADTSPASVTGYLADLLKKRIVVDQSEGKIAFFGRQFKLHSPPDSTPLNPIAPLSISFQNSGPRYVCDIEETVEPASRDFGGGLFRLSDKRFIAWQSLKQVIAASVSQSSRGTNVWSIGVDGFSSNTILAEVWNRLVANLYLAGLEEVHAGSRTSFVPYWNYVPAPGKPDSTWAAKFEFDDTLDGLSALTDDKYYSLDAAQPSTRPTAAVFTRLLSVRPHVSKIENVEATLAAVQSHDRSPLKFRCNIEVPDADDVRTPWIMFLTPATNARPTDKPPKCADGLCAPVRSGSLDLVFPQPVDLITSSGVAAGGTKDFNSLRWQFTPQLSNGACAADLRAGDYCLLPQVELQLNFQLAHVRPGGQDEIVTSEYAEPYELIRSQSGGQVIPCDSEIESNFARDAPLVLPRPGRPLSASVNNWKLQVQEQLISEKSQTLRMSLRVDSSKGALQTTDSVIILDRQPLTVAEVIFNPLQRRDKTSSVVAEWSNANGRGSSWRLIELEDTRPQIVFPPQIVGEEMERSKQLCAASSDKCEDRIFDLRLGPPTTITLSRSDTRYVEAPWNLRRLLTDDKVLVSKLSYELLYGLACTAEYPYLRFAEISVLYGAIRGRLPLAPMSSSTNQIASNTFECKDAKDSYVQARLFWSRVYREYLSRVGLYVPHDEQHPSELKMVASCRLRIRKNATRTDYSQDDPYWNDSDISPDFGDDKGFKGGALWGVEVAGIYNNIVAKSSGDPIRSTSAELTNPTFTALGGYGTTLARFDEDRSTLVGAAALGRTTTYSVERIGRIGVFWNHAKHVIVYERSVLPSRQFATSQQWYKGRAVVRKVSEYVEFLQPDRDFSAVDSETPLPGFAKGFTCGEKRRVNVDSSWGTSVSSVGWKVPLWNPPASTTLPDVYPEPQFYIRVQTAEKDSKGNFIQQLCPVTQPQNVFFYTSLAQHEGSDSDTWQAVESVDFVNLPLVAPDSGCYNTGDIGKKAAPDPAVPPGYQPVTFSIQSPNTGVHVTDGFASGAFAANLRTITLSRGPLPSLLDTASPVVVAVTGTAQRFDELVNAIPVESDKLDGQAAAAVKSAVQTTINQLKQQIDSVKGSLTATRDQFAARVATELNDRFNKVVPNIQTELDKDENDSALIREINAANESLQSELSSVAKTDWGIVVSRHVDNLQSQFERTVGPIDPAYRIRSLLPAAVGRFSDAAGLIVCDSSQQNCSLVLETLWSQPDYIARIQSALADFERARTALASDLEGVRGVVSVLDPSLVTSGTGLGAIAEQFRSLVADLNTRYEALRAANKSFEDIRATLKKEFNDKQGADRLGALNHDIKAAVQKLQTQLAALAALPNPESLCNKIILSNLATRIQTAANLSAAQKLVDDALRPAAIQQALKTADIAASAKTNLNALLTLAASWILNQQDTLKNLQGSLDTLVNGIVSGVTVDSLIKGIAATRSSIEGEIQDYAQNAVNVMRSDTVASKEKALKLLRAFGEPPQVPQLQFARPEIAYLYDQVNRRIPITPVLARANQVQEALNALDIKVPSVQLGDDLIPADLKNFDLNKIFPSFAGLQMSNLLAGLKLPDVANNAVKVTHGWEPQSRRAWLNADVDLPISGRQSLFAFGPISLQLVESRLQAKSQVSSNVDSATIQQVTEGSIGGRWEVCLQSFNIVSFVDTQLTFDRNGKLHFNFSPQKIELPSALQFVSTLFSSILDPNSGVSIGAMAGGVRCTFNLPIPDSSALTSGITGLRLATVFAIFVDDNSQFAISLGFQLSRREQPFNFAVFILGGSGFADIAATYVPATGKLTPRGEVSIACSASLAIALGPISGGVYAHFGIDGTLSDGHFHFGVFLLFAGHVSLLGIVSIDVSMYLEASYDGGTVHAWGHVEYKIKMFMFTLEVSVDVGTRINSTGQSGALRQNDAPVLAALETGDGNVPGLAYAFAHAGTTDSSPPLTPAERYIRMLV